MSVQQPQDKKHGETGNMGRIMVYLAWLLLLGLLSWLFSGVLERQYNPNSRLAHVTDRQAQSAEVVLQRNRWGHYVVTGHINGQAAVFMLDTGATDISIPAGLAERLELKRGAERIYQTAKGPARAWSTRLQRVSIGPIELTELRAHINPNVEGEEVLLGMTFLKHLEMVQRGDTLTLRYDISGRNP